MSYFHPERIPVLPARRRKAARLQLEQLVRRTAGRPKRRRPAVVAAVIAIVGLSTGAAAFAVAASRPVTNKQMARCFTSANTSGFAAMIAVPGRPGTRGHVNNAHAMCADLFKDGFLKRGVQREFGQPSKAEQPLPHLVVCVWRDKTAAVFPGPRGTCARLNLQAAARR
jgi:hypothetical protein